MQRDAGKAVFVFKTFPTLFIALTLILFAALPAPLRAEHIIITDTEGRKVRIPPKVERAAVLSATCIETIYILGKIDKVAGVSRDIISNPLLPGIIKRLKDIPVVSQSIRDINIEKVMALKPDIVITMGPEHPLGMDTNTVKRIENVGIPVVLINLDSLEENFHSIRLMGKIFDEADKAEDLVTYMQGIVREVQGKVQKIPPDERAKALYIAGDRPNYIAGGYWGDQDIRVMAGAINVASEIKKFMTVVSMEQILIWNPDVITITNAAKYSPEDVMKNAQLKNISAVRNKKVFKHPYHVAGLFTPRVVLLLAWHASKFYPELNIDWVKITDDFFRKFYGIPYYGPKA